MNRGEIISALKSYFQQKAIAYNIDMAFLYGSWADGCPKAESDIDMAIMLDTEKAEEEIFDIINNMTLEITYILKKEVGIIYIDPELSKPILHYNAIVHGIPVFMKDFTRYVDIKLKAISRMEDFSIFGVKWQDEIVRKRMEAIACA